MADDDDMEWFEEGKCRLLYKLGLFPTRTYVDDEGNEFQVENDPSIFFPEKGESVEPAKSVCLGTDGRPPCLVLETCRVHAVANERYGVWGGMSERERSLFRARLRRQQRVQQKKVVRGSSLLDRDVREA